MNDLKKVREILLEYRGSIDAAARKIRPALLSVLIEKYEINLLPYQRIGNPVIELDALEIDYSGVPDLGRSLEQKSEWGLLGLGWIPKCTKKMLYLDKCFGDDSARIVLDLLCKPYLIMNIISDSEKIEFIEESDAHNYDEDLSNSIVRIERYMENHDKKILLLEE